VNVCAAPTALVEFGLIVIRRSGEGVCAASEQSMFWLSE